MPTALPIIRGTSTALYPFTQVFTAQTSVSDSEAGYPSRCPSGLPLVRFEFPYVRMTQAERDTLKAAFSSAKGQLTGGSGSAGLTATTDITYSDLGFDEDEFASMEQVSTQYGVKWSLSQTLPQDFSPGASGGAYPTLGIGAIGLLPYTQRKRFQTIVSKMDSGPKYTYSEFGGPLTNYPPFLMAWEFDEPALIDTDVAIKVAHWLANWGNAFPFSFTDEDATVYSNVYYGSPVLTIEHLQFNQSHIRTSLIQMN